MLLLITEQFDSYKKPNSNMKIESLSVNNGYIIIFTKLTHVSWSGSRLPRH